MEKSYWSRKKTACARESNEQRAFFQWAGIAGKQRPELKLLFSVPNGAACSEFERTRLVSEGLRAGVPDLLFPVARGPYHGLAIEMKREKGGVVRIEQALWLDALRRAGWFAVVCRGANDAISTVEQYLDLGEFNIGAAGLSLPASDMADENTITVARRACVNDDWVFNPRVYGRG